MRPKIAQKVFTTASPAQTRALAGALAGLLKGGEIIFFSGPIGAGKTVMVSAIAAAFGFKQRPVSASFSLMRRYKNKRATVYHIDLFRLQSGEMFNLGFEEMLSDPKAIILAEWPAAAADFLPQQRLEVDVALKTGDGRQITFCAKGQTYARLLEDLCKITK